MAYPYIGKNKHGVKALIYSRNSARILNGECVGQMHDMSVVDNNWFERKYENITADYLRNTKVKIESDEHLSFIFDLIDGTDLMCEASSEYAYIYEHSIEDVRREITLPLPPKESEEWPVVGDRVYVTSEVMKNNSMQEAAELISETYCQVVARFTHNDIDFCVLKNTDSAYTTLTVDLCINDKTIVREKPPTPEEGLENSISIWMGENKASIGDGKLAKAIINGEIKGLSYKPE